MSVFRIQRKRLESDSKHKVHSEQSKSHTKNGKKLTELLNSVRQKQQTHLQIKRRIITLQEKEQDSNITKLKRISETYNIKTNRKDSMGNSKISKNSLSRTKFFPVFSPGKHSNTKFHPYHGIARSSPKLQSKLSGQLKSPQKINASEHKISLSKQKENAKKQYISLNSSIVANTAKSKIQTNRIMTDDKVKQLKQAYDEVTKDVKQAMEYYRKRNSYKALMLFKECLKYDPQNVDCLYFMGSCCLNLQNYQQSIKYLSHAKNLNPSYSQNMYLYLAICFKMVKKEDEAIRILQIGVNKFLDFEDGYLYIGKIYLRQSKFQQAISTLQACVQVNSNNVISKIMLADACCMANQELRAIQILQQLVPHQSFDKLDSKTQISTHLKLIKLLLNLQMYEDSFLKKSLSFLQDNVPTSPELAYYISALKYQTTAQITSKQLSEMKINLYFSLNQLNTYPMVVECTKLLLKIFIDNKDFYGAEETLKRITHSEVKPEYLKDWALVIEGANDIIKRKNEEGKKKMLKCIKKLNKINPYKSDLLFQPNTKDIYYLKLHALSFLAYIFYLEDNMTQSFSVYEQILSQPAPRTYREGTNQVFESKFFKKYQQNYKEISLNKIVIEAIIEHKINTNFQKAKKLFQILLQRRTTPEPIFLWAINQISILKQTQTDFSNQQHDSLSQSSQSQQNPKMYEGFDWNIFFDKIQKAEAISPNYSLIYFYHSLVLLYLQSNSQALKMAQKAIQKADQPVSEYHFIQALCHYAIFQERRKIQSAFRGLEAIDKAIQIDSGIPEFYKERSKHLFCLGKYEQSIKDCEKCQEENPDDEVKLLCMFYSYAASKYERSEALLQGLAYSGDQTISNNKQTNQMIQKQTSQMIQKQTPQTTQKEKQKQNPFNVQESDENDNEHKYKEFEQAVNFRLKKYGQTGFIGRLLLALTDQSRPKLENNYLKLIKDAIKDRHQYSEFTVYFMNLLMAAYFIQRDDFTTSLNFLFACLEEIQCIVDEKQSKMHSDDDNQSEDASIAPLKSKINDEIFHINTDEMLNQIKYNIVIATLIKNRHDQMTQNDCAAKSSDKVSLISKEAKCVQEIYKEALNLIQTFMRQSHCDELIQTLEVIKSLILKSQNTSLSQNKAEMKLLSQTGSIPVYLKPYQETQKFSDQMTFMLIPIGDKFVLMTKFLIFYPIKLRFNIKPEFDPSFLFNFDIDKVDNKITPPWYKFSEVQFQGQFQNRIIFTDQLRNQSIAISSTERGPSVFGNRKSKNRYEKNAINESQKLQEPKANTSHKQLDLKKIIKLDSKIEKKLKKLFPK